MSGEDDVVVEDEAECRPQAEADDVGRDVVRQRGGQPQDVVGEEQAELRDGDAAQVGQDEQRGLAGDVLLGAAPVGPVAVREKTVAVEEASSWAELG